MQQLYLSIPQPCHQSWNDMSPNEQGRFCSSCAKTVIDFSVMTDAQLIRYFENLKNENVCGRAYPDQLNRSIEALPPPRKKIIWYWQYIIAFFMMLGKGQQVKAQGKVRPQTTQQPDTAKKDPAIVHIMLGGIRRYPLPPKTTTIASPLPQYFITDKNNQPIAGASVQLLPQGTWLVSDSTGKINLGLKHKVKSLQVSSVGFEEKTIALKDVPGNNIIRLIPKQWSLEDVTIKSDWSGRRLGGLWAVRYVTNYTVRDSSQNIFNPAISIYPNPVAKGGIVTLDLSLQKGKQYKIQVIDATGKMVLQQNYTVAGKNSVCQVAIPATLSNGTYFVSMVNEKGKIVGTAKAVVN